MDIRMPNNNGGEFRSKDVQQQNTQQHGFGSGEVTINTNLAVMNALYDLTGNENATTVLTSVVNQNFLRFATDSLSNPDGSPIVWQPTGANSTGLVFNALDGSGPQPVDPPGLGGSPVQLSLTPGGNYKVEVELPVYYSHDGRGFEKQDFPGMDGSCILGTARLSFEVDAGQAALGQVVIHNATLSQQIDGRMA
jgi:hypothetical protein